jgi:hypothetical protein
MTKTYRWGDALDGPVGLRWRRERVRNLYDDQNYVIGELQQIPSALGGKQEAWRRGAPSPTANGVCPPDLVEAIYDFQEFWKSQDKLKVADGVCDPRGSTIRLMELAVIGLAFAPDPLRNKAPEGQLDATACWAASYAWWLRGTPGMMPVRQDAILALGALAAGTVTPTGTVNVNGFMLFLPGLHPGMRSSQISPGELKDFLSTSRLPAFPIIIGFASSIMGGHVNVIHSFDQTRGNVTVMEPWYPDPSANPNYELVNNDGIFAFERKGDHVPFQFQGTHVTRPLSYYSSRPLNGRMLVFPDHR